jgi:riboflavin biosynthesis pyrimidine reductase
VKNIIQLYPLPSQEHPLEGTYLAHHLRQYGQASVKSFVYGNYILSLDGRIAVPRPTRPGLMVPKQIANPRDWRLFQELAAQADLIIISSRYLQNWAEGRVNELLQVDRPEFADLGDWRLAQGLPPQPDIAIISSALQFSIPEVLPVSGRKLVVFTTAAADPERIREIEAEGGQVILAGESQVVATQVAQRLVELGYLTVYLTAGPKVLHLLLTGGVMDRLYLTYANRILGGQPYLGLVEGPLLEPAFNMTLDRLYFDPYGLDGLGQLFVSYNRL